MPLPRRSRPTPCPPLAHRTRRRSRGPSRIGSLRVLRPTLVVAIVLGSLGHGCSDINSVEEETIPTERFVEVYVQLRLEAEGPDGIPAERRDEILREHGVRAVDLLRFVEVHGGDVAFMHDVWSEIENRIAEAR